MDMIGGSQIRAARGLLDWPQYNLADTSHVSRATINSFENGSPIRADKIKLLHKTLQDHGLEFLNDDGVRRQTILTVHATSAPAHDIMAPSILALIHEHQEKRNALHDAIEALELVMTDGLTYSSEQVAERAVTNIKKIVSR